MDFDKWHRYKRLTSIYRVCHCLRVCVCVVLLSDWHIWCMSWVWIITPCLIINKKFIYFLAYIQWLDRSKLKLKLKTKPFHSQTNVKKQHIINNKNTLVINRVCVEVICIRIVCKLCTEVKNWDDPIFIDKTDYKFLFDNNNNNN